MDYELTALSIIEDVRITRGNILPHYSNDLTRAGLVADELSREDAFAEYHANCTANTHAGQRNDLKLVAAYLAEAGVKRQPEDLYADAEASRGMSRGLRMGVRTLLQHRGSA